MYIKKLFFGFICIITTNVILAQQQLKPNNFVVGISYSAISMFTKDGVPNVPYQCDGIITMTNPYFDSINYYKLDGFNTVHFYQPSFWSHSENRMATLLELAKNIGGIKIETCGDGWFVPISAQHDDNGFNCFNNDLSGSPFWKWQN